MPPNGMTLKGHSMTSQQRLAYYAATTDPLSGPPLAAWVNRATMLTMVEFFDPQRFQTALTSDRPEAAILTDKTSTLSTILTDVVMESTDLDAARHHLVRAAIGAIQAAWADNPEPPLYVHALTAITDTDIRTGDVHASLAILRAVVEDDDLARLAVAIAHAIHNPARNYLAGAAHLVEALNTDAFLRRGLWVEPAVDAWWHVWGPRAATAAADWLGPLTTGIPDTHETARRAAYQALARHLTSAGHTITDTARALSTTRQTIYNYLKDRRARPAYSHGPDHCRQSKFPASRAH